MQKSLKNSLVNLVRLNGQISVSQFIEEALFHPTLGYYNIKQPFGCDGDFITSPEISQLFGESIAIYLVHIYQFYYKNNTISFVEAGAGRGTLMSDILKTFKKFNFDPEANIIEKSIKLTNLQQQNLKNHSIIWHKEFADFTKKNQNPIFFIANELFDCFPINQFIRSENSWKEIVISLNTDNELQFSTSYNITPLEKKYDDLPKNVILEVSSLAQNFMSEIAIEISNNGGLGIIIDYGYEKSPLTSTLQAIKNHQKCDILKNIGQCDISALVNFKLLQKIAEDHNLKTSLISQREFLLSLGIEQRTSQIKENSDLIKSQINRLTNKEQMGELFKVLIFWK